MAGLSEDVLAGMAIDRVVTDQEYRSLGHEMLQDESGQRAAELQIRPACA